MNEAEISQIRASIALNLSLMESEVSCITKVGNAFDGSTESASEFYKAIERLNVSLGRCNGLAKSLINRCGTRQFEGMVNES